MNYKKAFKCSKCPESNGELGCPVWWEVVLKNDETGEMKITKNCGFQILPEMMALVSTNSLHSVAASYDMRNKVIKNAGKIIGAINDKLELGFDKEEIEDMSSSDEEVKFLEDRRDE